MGQYKITLEIDNLLLHQYNFSYMAKIKAWQMAPENKELSVKGDDRSPAWTWIGGLYHDGKVIGINTDNLMTMLREGGARTPTGKGTGSYKKQTQSGIIIDQIQWPIDVGNGPIPIGPINALIGETDFDKHMEVAESLGFELFVKPARIGRSKNIRVRPLFRHAIVTGSLTILDEEMCGINQTILTTILKQAGALCGIGDWRPSSPASGVFGRFLSTIERM